MVEVTDKEWINFEGYNSCCEELRELYTEFMNKSRDLLEDSLKERIKAIVRREKSQANWNADLTEREKKLDARELELERLEAKIDENSSEVIHRMLEKFGLDLNFGQKVYFVYTDNHPEKCEFCQGTGTLKLEKTDIKFEARCPKCKGSGKINNYEYTIHTGTLSDAHIQLYFNDRDVKEKLKREYDYAWDSSYQFYLEHIQPPIKAYNGGYESYIKKDRKDLFVTYAEAEERMKELQEKDKEGK